MDKLSELPLKDDTIKTPEEEAAMTSFFPSTNDISVKTSLPWKFIGSTAVVFLLLANPWIDKLFCNIPYCGDNSMILFAIKMLLFLLTIILLCYFM